MLHTAQAHAPGKVASADSSWASLLQRLPASVQEVVDMSPSLTSDGAVVLGTRQTTVMLVDPGSGRVIRSFGQGGNSSKSLAAPGVLCSMSGHVCTKAWHVACWKTAAFDVCASDVLAVCACTQSCLASKAPAHLLYQFSSCSASL